MCMDERNELDEILADAHTLCDLDRHLETFLSEYSQSQPDTYFTSRLVGGKDAHITRDNA